MPIFDNRQMQIPTNCALRWVCWMRVRFNFICVAEMLQWHSSAISPRVLIITFGTASGINNRLYRPVADLLLFDNRNVTRNIATGSWTCIFQCVFIFWVIFTSNIEITSIIVIQLCRPGKARTCRVQFSGISQFVWNSVCSWFWCYNFNFKEMGE